MEKIDENSIPRQPRTSATTVQRLSREQTGNNNNNINVERTRSAPSPQKRKREKHERARSAISISTVFRFRCLITSVNGVDLKLPPHSKQNVPNPCFRFVFSNVKPFMTPVVKKTENPIYDKWENQWVWETAESDKLNTKHLWIEYLSERSSGVTKKVSKIGETQLDLLSVCTGPTHYELQLFSVTDPTQCVGWVQFDFEMEQFHRRTLLNLDITIIPTVDPTLADDLFVKVTPLPNGIDDIKGRPNVKSRTLKQGNYSNILSIPSILFSDASCKGLLDAQIHIILLAKQSKQKNFALVGAQTIVEIPHLLDFLSKMKVYETEVHRNNRQVGKIKLKATWENLPQYVQMFRGVRNSQKGVTGEVVEGVPIPQFDSNLPVQIKTFHPIQKTPTLLDKEDADTDNDNDEEEDEEDDSESTEKDDTTSLPAGWEKSLDPSGQIIYIDQINKIIQHKLPLLAASEGSVERRKNSRHPGFFGNNRFSLEVSSNATVFREEKKDDKIKPGVSRTVITSKPQADSSNSTATTENRANRLLTTVGEYTIIDEIGKGRFAVVYRAKHQENGKIVAIKESNLNPADIHLLPTIQREAGLLQSLDHPNIVKIFEVVNTKKKVYVILEYVNQGDLFKQMKQNGVFKEPVVSQYIQQVLCGLQYLHSKNIIHRDIKSANLLIDSNGTIKLADFGTARLVDSTQKNMTVIGTPFWMAPEIIDLEACSVSADIWSLGCTCIELLTGQPPYFELPTMTALYKICEDEHPPIPQGISKELEDFLVRGVFVKDPVKRWNAEQLLQHPWILGTKL
jgi:hypothetical protein